MQSGEHIHLHRDSSEQKKNRSIEWENKNCKHKYRRPSQTTYIKWIHNILNAIIHDIAVRSFTKIYTQATQRHPHTSIKTIKKRTKNELTHCC